MYTKRTRAFLRKIVQKHNYLLIVLLIGEKISSFLNDLNIPQLSKEQKNSCEGLISSEECSKLLDSFQSNKSPGSDGIPAEFYRKFWPLICEGFIYPVRK